MFEHGLSRIFNNREPEYHSMKGYRGVALVLAVVVMVPAVAAQSEFEGDLKSLRINETTDLQVTLENQLPINDTYTVVFSDDAITQGLITPDFPDSNGIRCNEVQNTCDIDIGASADVNFTIALEGTAIGQGILTGSVNSTQTQLSNGDQIQVRVEPNFGTVTVSAPGITLAQLLVLAVVGTLVAAGMRTEDIKGRPAHPET